MKKMTGLDIVKIAKKEGRVTDKEVLWFCCDDKDSEAFSKFFEENPLAGSDVVLSNYVSGYTRGFGKGFLRGSIIGAVFAALGYAAADIFF